MKPYRLLLFCCLLISMQACAQHKKDYQVQTIAFYNVENLFDTFDDPLTYDDARTPTGKDHWTLNNYQDKINKMAGVIAEIGTDFSKKSPAIIGVAEIENRKVLEDLVNTDALRSKDYGIVHYDSPDKRGIDVALLYQKAKFRVRSSSSHELRIYQQKKHTKSRIYTRDQLLVSGLLEGDLIHLLVNHWPSRRGGEARSSYKREKAAWLNKRIIDSLFVTDPNSKIVIMGDFNDDPHNRSIRKILKATGDKKKVPQKGIYNPMANIHKKGIGSLAYRDRWNLFDQIMVSKVFLEKQTNSFRYFKSGVYNKKNLTTNRGKYKGYPFRSYVNGTYTGGYSDHFPVFIYLIKPIQKE